MAIELAPFSLFFSSSKICYCLILYFFKKHFLNLLFLNLTLIQNLFPSMLKNLIWKHSWLVSKDVFSNPPKQSGILERQSCSCSCSCVAAAVRPLCEPPDWLATSAVCPSDRVSGSLRSMWGTPEPAGECWESVLMVCGMMGMSVTGVLQGVRPYLCALQGLTAGMHCGAGTVVNTATTVRRVLERRRPLWARWAHSRSLGDANYVLSILFSCSHRMLRKTAWSSSDLLCTLSRHIWMLRDLCVSYDFSNISYVLDVSGKAWQ